MPLFNSSILTSSQENNYSYIQFGAQNDGSSLPGSNISGITRPYLNTTSPTTTNPTTDIGDNAILNDPQGLIQLVGTTGVVMNWTQVGSTPNYVTTQTRIRLKNSGNHKFTLVKQYDSYGANTDKVSLVYVVGAGGGEYNNQNRILDLYDTDSAGGTSIPLQTTATVNIPSLYKDITMFLVGKPLSSGGVNCTGFCRFKIERV